MRALLFVLALVLFSGAHAQDIRNETIPHGSLRRAGERLAEKANFKEWPLVADGGKGTQVHVTFDYDNADIILLANPAPGHPKMLEVGRRIATALHMPRADYIFVPEQDYGSIDVELNKYLTKREKTHSIKIDLAVLAQALQDSPELPKPISIRVDADDADTGIVTAPGQNPTQVSKSAFYHLTDLKPGTTVQFGATVTWVAYLAAAILLGIFLVPISILVRLPWALEKSRREQIEKAKQAESIPDPEEVQKKYDNRKRNWLTMLTPAMPLLALLAISGGGREGMKQASRLVSLQPGTDPRLFMLAPLLMILGIFGISRIVYALDKRRRIRTDPTLAEVSKFKPPTDDSVASLRYLPLMMLPIFPMIGLMFVPAFRALKSNVRMEIIFGGMFTYWIILAVVAAYKTRKSRPERKEGDWVYEAAHEYANVANVKVRRVETRPSKSANASVNLFGTVAVTSGLIEKFEPDEVRAIVAHEIGHIKAQHLKKLLPLNLALVAIVWTAYYFGTEALKGHVSDEVYSLLTGPIIILFPFPIITALVLGRRRRKHEEEADRFAAEVTGDKELVIRALTKVHAINETPQRLRPLDEALATHPSLENRIKALRGDPTSQE